MSLVRELNGRLALMMAAVAISGAILCAPAHAQSGASDSSWKFEFTPYLWLSGIKGEFGNGSTAPGGQPPRVDAKFENVLDALDSAFMGSIEARKGRWGILGDVIYLSFSEDASVKLAPSLASPGVKFAAELDGTVFTLGGAYRISEGATNVDVVGAARYYSLEPSVNVTAGAVQRLVEPTASWTDPVIGLRARHPLSPQWELTGYADVGGFGVGSEFSYQFYAGAEYQFSKAFSGKIGFRQLRTDYEKDDRKMDLTFSGFMLGLGIHF